MDYVNIERNMLQASIEARKFFGLNPGIANMVVEIRRSEGLCFKLNTGDRILFMSDVLFDRWCLGRTYKMLGGSTIYHSRTIVSEEGVNKDD